MHSIRKRKIISFLLTAACIVISVWFFNFAIGGPVFSFECFIYSAVTSFAVTYLNCFVVLKSICSKKLFAAIYFSVLAAELALYKPLVLLMFFAI